MNRFTNWLPLSWQIFLHEWGAFLFACALFFIFAGLYMFRTTLGPHESAGFVTAKVESTFDVSDELEYDVRAVVVLPSGNRATVRARSIAQAQWLIDTSCVERRVRENGAEFYRLVAPNNCSD